MKVRSVTYWMALLLFVLGCQAKTGEVSGTVRYEGQALPSGRIVFYCDGGDQPVLMSDVVEGGYTVNDAPIGDSRITVETFQTKTTRVPGQFNSPVVDDQEFGETITGEYVRIPDRYGSPDNSKLTLKIEADDNAHDLELHE